MTEIILKGKVKQILTRSNDTKVYYIYQFETIDNKSYLKIIDVYSKNKIPFVDVKSLCEMPITISFNDDGIYYEIKTENLIKEI